MRSIKAFYRKVSAHAALRATAMTLVWGALCAVALQACGSSDSDSDSDSLPGSSAPSAAFNLFECSPCDPWPGDYGVAGCTTQKPTPGVCNPNCPSYTTSVENGIRMRAGNDCHTVNSHSACTFDIGNGGVTQIDFDFTVTDACHRTVNTTEWLSFWIYSRPWSTTVEADFIESLFGPGGKNGALNANFAGNGQQVIIFPNATRGWNGHITAKFSGTGNNVTATITNSQNSQVATSRMTGSTGYFFVMDTALGSGGNTNCAFTVTNLKMQGTVPQGQCQGIMAN